MGVCAREVDTGCLHTLQLRGLPACNILFYLEPHFTVHIIFYYQPVDYSPLFSICGITGEDLPELLEWGKVRTCTYVLLGYGIAI